MFKKGRTKGTVRFTIQSGNNVKKAFLAADFTNWQPQAMRKTKAGSFGVTVPLNPGTYQYKFLLDGDWIEDPEHDAKIANEFGGQNSLACIQ